MDAFFGVTSLKMMSLRVTSLLYNKISQTRHFQTCHPKNTGPLPDDFYSLMHCFQSLKPIVTTEEPEKNRKIQGEADHSSVLLLCSNCG